MKLLKSTGTVPALTWVGGTGVPRRTPVTSRDSPPGGSRRRWVLGPLRPGLCDLARSNPRNTFMPRNKVQGGYCRCVRAQIPPSPKSATPRCPGLFAKRPPLPPPPPSVLPVRAPVADTYPLEYRRMRLVHPLPGGGPVSKVHGGVLTPLRCLL